MTDRGGVEFEKVNDPVAEKLRAAKQKLTEGDKVTAGEAIAAVAKRAAFTIESDDSNPRANYTLQRVKYVDLHGLQSVQYFLQPPSEMQKNHDVGMILVTVADGEKATGVKLIRSDEFPYAPYTESEASEPAEVLDVVAEMYRGIKEKGISISGNVVVVKDAEGGEFFDKFTWSRGLEPTLPERVKDQDDRARMVTRANAHVKERGIGRAQPPQPRPATQAPTVSMDEIQKRIQADIAPREEEESFEEAVANYALTTEVTEPVDLEKHPLRASYVASARHLMWDRGADGTIIPGALFRDENRPLMERLLGGRMDPDTHYTLQQLQPLLEKNAFSVSYDPEIGQEVITATANERSGIYERGGDFESPDEVEILYYYRPVTNRIGALRIQPKEHTGFSDFAVTIAPDEEVPAVKVDLEGKPVPNEAPIAARPILQADITKEDGSRVTLYRCREGVLVKEPDGQAKCYPDILFAPGKGEAISV